MKNEYRFKVKPFEHQLKEWLRSRELESFAVFWEMGTGKSKLILDTAAWLYDHGKIDSLLILANKGSYLNWVDKHVPEHLPDHVKREIAWWDAGKASRKLKEIENLLRKRLCLRILAINVEALAYNKGRKLVEQFALNTRCLGVVDESTAIKNPKALRTKALLKLKKLFPYKRILTGSPAANGPLNLYSQAEFLGDWLLGHDSWYSYRAEYCNLVEMRIATHSFKKVTGYRNLDKLARVMAPWSSTIKKEDCLDLPPKIYETCLVEMTSEQARVYQELKERSIAELSQGVVTVELVLTKLLRLQQVLSGHVPNEEGILVELPDERLPRLMELLDEVNGKAVIWARFTRDVDRITIALNKEYGPGTAVAYHGATGGEERRIALSRFQGDSYRNLPADDSCRFFVGNPQTGGYGITLTAASTVVYYSNSFDLEVRLQSEDRCHRAGQIKSVTYIDLCTPKTVDEKILKALREKKKISDLIMSLSGWKELF